MWRLHLPKCRPPFLQPPGDINLLTSVNNRQAHGSKREVAKTPHVSLLLSNLLLCCDFVHVYAIKLTKWTSKRCKKMWDWGDGSSQTCCQRNTNSTTVIAMIVNATEAHACAPITNRNANRDIKNKEIQNGQPFCTEILTAIRLHCPHMSTPSDKTSIESSHKRCSHGMPHWNDTGFSNP